MATLRLLVLVLTALLVTPLPAAAAMAPAAVNPVERFEAPRRPAPAADAALHAAPSEPAAPRHGQTTESAIQGIVRSLQKIGEWGVVLRLLLGMALAVACAAVIAWHPRRSTKANPLTDLEERKTLIVLGLVGAVVAELVTAQMTEVGDVMAQYLAFVIFGIGALLRFRTALDNPKLTGKAILVVVIGIACGLNEWALALWVTGATFALIFWLDSHLACRVRIRLGPKEDPKHAYGAVQEYLLKNRCRVKDSHVYEAKRQVVFLTYIPAGLDPVDLEAGIRSALPKESVPRIEVRVA